MRKEREMDMGKEDDFERLDPNKEYRTEIVRVPMAELFAAMPEAYRADWVWNGAQQAPTPEEVADLLDGVVRHAETLPEPSCGTLLALMEGRGVALAVENLVFVRLLMPMRVDSAGEGSLRLTLPAELLDAWPSFPGRAALPERIRHLAGLLRSMDALANLYGAISLEDALPILRGLGLWDDERDLPFMDQLELRSVSREDPGAYVHDGVVYMPYASIPDGLLFKQARQLLKFLDGLPRWVPATADELLAWSDPDHIEDTPANAAVAVWALENTGPCDPATVREMVADASLQIRSGADGDPYIALFDDHGDDDESAGPPPGLRDQFIASQRRWILCGHNSMEIGQLGDSPEVQAWFARHEKQKTGPKRNNKKKNRKKHGKRR